MRARTSKGFKIPGPSGNWDEGTSDASQNVMKGFEGLLPVVAPCSTVNPLVPGVEADRGGGAAIGQCAPIERFHGASLGRGWAGLHWRDQGRSISKARSGVENVGKNAGMTSLPLFWGSPSSSPHLWRNDHGDRAFPALTGFDCDGGLLGRLRVAILGVLMNARCHLSPMAVTECWFCCPKNFY